MDRFDEKVQEIIGVVGQEKGYGPEDGASLFSMCRELPHPLGEIVYKVFRYNRLGEEMDIIKVAAWAKLVWNSKHNDRRQMTLEDLPPLSPVQCRCRRYQAVPNGPWVTDRESCPIHCGSQS